MVFSSLSFLFLFFPIVIIGYIFINESYANIWLLMTSLIFYYIGDSKHFNLLIGIILIGYLAGVFLQNFNSDSVRKSIMLIAILLMILLMSYYKYCNFIIENINFIVHKNIAFRDIIFPIGISFFVFQAISYVIDVYRGEKALLNPIDMALYISFFPQLIAGPIVRFHNISRFMNKEYRKFSFKNLECGIWRFSIGLSKKVLLANNLGGLADLVFNVSDISDFSVMYTWLGAIAYTLQIYFDFSGYSDMAIGLGKIFGFSFQENFNYPYIAKSVKDFWRRWHMSLSQFFRDYIYIPLGGNKCTLRRWIVNILCVWFLTGLWHGASWNYVIWGSLYGVLLIVERLINFKKSNNWLLNCFRHVYTLTIVTVLWVVFRTPNLNLAIAFVKNMFGIGAKSFVDQAFVFQFRNYWFLIFVGIICSVPLFDILQKKVGKCRVLEYIKMAILVGCTVSAVSFIYMGSYNPFLYFMF